MTNEEMQERQRLLLKMIHEAQEMVSGSKAEHVSPEYVRAMAGLIVRTCGLTDDDMQTIQNIIREGFVK